MGSVTKWEKLSERSSACVPRTVKAAKLGQHGSEVCERKARVQFPSQAQGWIALNCMGLSEEQKAIVKAKTQGKLEVDLVTAALRSCFPVYKASASRSRRAVTTLIAEPDDGGGLDDEDDSFQDVEAFLADYGLDQPQEDRDKYQEEETG